MLVKLWMETTAVYSNMAEEMDDYIASLAINTARTQNYELHSSIKVEVTTRKVVFGYCIAVRGFWDNNTNQISCLFCLLLWDINKEI